MGSETPASAMAITPRSMTLPRRSAEMTPAETPPTSHRIAAPTASEIVTGSRSRMSGSTGFWVMKEYPRHGARSEERRVGKECRSRWSAYHEKKNLKPSIEACGISTFIPSPMLSFHKQMYNRIKLLEELLSSLLQVVEFDDGDMHVHGHKDASAV